MIPKQYRSSGRPIRRNFGLEYGLRDGLFWWFALIGILAVVSLVLSVLLIFDSANYAFIPEILTATLFVLVASVFGLALKITKRSLTPLVEIQRWASQIRQGDFSARLPRPEGHQLENLVNDINRLSEWLDKLAQERDFELRSQQERVAQRADFANELHDSLAQTLASLKFQIRVLDDTLRQDSEQAIWQEMERIQVSIDEANVELRELITHFRAPLSGRGLVPGIRRLMSRFRKETDMEIVLQTQSKEPKFSPEEETQILRIVQESLANVRKHSRANMVRLLLSETAKNQFRIIIEDDGEGMLNHDSTDDNHFGLSIMKERANSIGANLAIESEAGEGTRVLFELDLKDASDSSL